MAPPTAEAIFEKIEQAAENFPGANLLNGKQQRAIKQIWQRRDRLNNARTPTDEEQPPALKRWLRFLDALYPKYPHIHWLCVIAFVSKDVGRLKDVNRQHLIRLLKQCDTREHFNSLRSWEIKNSLPGITRQHTRAQISNIPGREHSLENVQNHYRRWVAQDIAASFGEQVAALTKCSVDHKITMAFPRGVVTDCYISFPLELSSAQRLVELWFGFELAVHDDGKLRIIKSGRKIGASGDLVFGGVTEDEIQGVLGPRMLRNIADSKLRKLECSQGILQTDCVSVSVSVSSRDCMLNFVIDLESATTILQQMSNRT